jgi:hypothetical protein
MLLFCTSFVTTEYKIRLKEEMIMWNKIDTDISVDKTHNTRDMLGFNLVEVFLY